MENGGGGCTTQRARLKSEKAKTETSEKSTRHRARTGVFLGRSRGADPIIKERRSTARKFLLRWKPDSHNFKKPAPGGPENKTETEEKAFTLDLAARSESLTGPPST